MQSYSVRFQVCCLDTLAIVGKTWNFLIYVYSKYLLLCGTLRKFWDHLNARGSAISIEICGEKSIQPCFTGEFSNSFRTALNHKSNTKVYLMQLLIGIKSPKNFNFSTFWKEKI